MPKKNISASEKFRNDGNREFMKKNLLEALSFYGKSVLNAPSGSVQLCLAFGNRSAVLCDLNFFEECLRDIDRALNIDVCPEEIIGKLKKRKEKCLKSVLECKFHLRKKQRNDKPPSMDEFNPQLPSVSKACSLQYNEKQGRFIIASDDIEPGKILMIENPYAFVILPHCADEFCHHCCELMPPDFVPCNLCADVKFCSEICRYEAMNSSYHRLECGELEILYNSGLAHLALRIFSFTDFDVLTDYFCPHRNENKLLNSKEGRYGLNNNEIYSCDYETVYNLVTNSDQIFFEDLKVYEKAGRGLVKFLEDKDFIDSFVSQMINDHKICSICREKSTIRENLVRILLRHIEQLICNAHAITSVDRVSRERTLNGDSNLDSTYQRKIASAVYPSVSLLNHSCDPNTFSSFVGKTVVVRATKHIKRGEEIFNCYGPRVGRMPSKNRRETLMQQYFFVCSCSSCSTESAHEKERLLSALACDQCRGPLRSNEHDNEFICNRCSTKFPRSLSDFVCKIKDRFAVAIPERNLPTINNELKILETFLFKNNKSLVEFRDLAAQIYVENGDFKSAALLLIRNLESNEFIFGEDSIEIANEIVKLVDFLDADEKQTMEKSLKKNILDLAAKAKQIFSIHYGSNCLQIEEITSIVGVETN